jgi:zinc finger CCCH domain-containing protein 13
VCPLCVLLLRIHNHRYAAPSAQQLPTSTPEGQPASGFAPSSSIESLVPSTAPSTKPSTPSTESSKPVGSRFFPNPSTSENVALQGQQEKQSTSAIRSPLPSQFNPPPGSRLLAFGSRTPSATAATAVSPDQLSAFTISASTFDPPPLIQHPVNSPHQISDMDTSSPHSAARGSVPTGLPPPGFSNLTNPPARLPLFPSDTSAHAQPEVLRRQSLVSFGDRVTYGTSPDLAAYSDISAINPLGPQSSTPNSQSPSFDSAGRERGHGGSPFPQQKGSRFAKFFDGKSREQPSVASTEDLGPLSHPLLQYQRQYGIGGGDSYTLDAENRTMEDIFAMLQNSSQVSQSVQVFTSGASHSLGTAPHSSRSSHPTF